MPNTSWFSSVGDCKRYCLLSCRQDNDGDQPEVAKRKGAGGCWRAFVHDRCKGHKLTGEFMQELSREYKRLDPIQRAQYSAMGRLATEARRCGGQTFPAYSHTAEVDRGVVGQAGVRHRKNRGNSDDVVAEAIKTEVSTLRRANQGHRENEKAILTDLKQVVAQSTLALLERRHQLKSATSSWAAVPHCCTSLHCYGEVSKMDSEALMSGSRPTLLEEAWVARHKGVRHEAAAQLPKMKAEQQMFHRRRDRVRRCWLHGSCLCSGNGRNTSRMWTKISQGLKELLHGRSDDLCEGMLILEWTSRSAEADDRDPKRRKGAACSSNSSAPDPVCSPPMYTYIPLHYKRPWRPTFLALEVPREAESQRWLGGLDIQATFAKWGSLVPDSSGVRCSSRSICHYNCYHLSHLYSSFSLSQCKRLGVCHS